MEQFIEQVGKLLGVVVPIAGMLVWFLKRIERGQSEIMRKVNKVDKHKVSFKVCDKRRAECPCKTQMKG